MNKKILSILLAGCMLLGCAGPALAETAPDDQALMAVTAKVKATLGLDTEVYTDFQGHSDEDVLLGKRWSLNWEGDGVSLSITAGDDGKIYSYSAARAAEDVAVVTPSRGNGGRLDIPRLPQDQSTAAFETAKAFLGKVLEAPAERVELSNEYQPSLRQDSYRYRGTVLLNGVESPITCSVTVRASDLTVLRFSRSDQYSGYLGGVPAAETAVSADKARSALRSTLKFEAKYVLQEDGKTARVQYVPVYGDDYYVDGATGELVNLTELRQKLLRGGTAGGDLHFTFMDAVANEAPEASMKQELTQAEKDGAAILKDAMSKEDLDKVLKNAWPEIGLDKYTLASASYSLREKEIEKGAERTPEDYDITCRLTYGKQQGSVSANKYVTVDAKTGELKSLRSTRYDRTYYMDSTPKEKFKWTISTPLNTAQSTAGLFLRSFAGGDTYDKLGLFSSDKAAADGHWEHTFTFQQTANGYFYEGNAYTVGIDATDGTVSYISGSFDPEVALTAPARVIGPDAAAAAYADALELRYGYLEVPVSISLAGRDLMPLLKEAGYTYVNALKTGFVLTQPDKGHVRGVDAESGQVVSQDYAPGEELTMTYGDIEDHWVKTAAEALAVFRVGFYGGSLKPGETLTQRDMLALLLSVEGYEFDPTKADKDAIDWLYDRGYSYGLVTPETREDGGTVTRGALVKALLDAAGYERVAALEGIFRCDYADAGAIPAGEMGYAALAQGLGLIKGGDQGEYAASRPATRAEAVAMLYQYMK